MGRGGCNAILIHFVSLYRVHEKHRLTYLVTATWCCCSGAFRGGACRGAHPLGEAEWALSIGEGGGQGNRSAMLAKRKCPQTKMPTHRGTDGRQRAEPARDGPRRGSSTCLLQVPGKRARGSPTPSHPPPPVAPPKPLTRGQRIPPPQERGLASHPTHCCRELSPHSSTPPPTGTGPVSLRWPPACPPAARPRQGATPQREFDGALNTPPAPPVSLLPSGLPPPQTLAPSSPPLMLLLPALLRPPPSPALTCGPVAASVAA